MRWTPRSFQYPSPPSPLLLLSPQYMPFLSSSLICQTRKTVSVTVSPAVLHSSQQHQPGRDKGNLFLYKHCLMSMTDKLTAQKTDVTKACFTDHFIRFLVNGVQVAKLPSSPVPPAQQYCCSLDPRPSTLSESDTLPSNSSTAHLMACRAQKERVQGTRFTAAVNPAGGTPACGVAHGGGSPALRGGLGSIPVLLLHCRNK